MSAIAFPSPLSLRLIATDIKLAHSVFAMPFALLAAFMAAEKVSDTFFQQLGLIVLAMVLARTVAMLANRLIDREIDRGNPRTINRALPSGRLPVGHAHSAIIIVATLFMLVCIAFGMMHDNWWPTILGLPVLAWISAYGYLKRFTSLCHLYLGSSLAMSPLAAAIAVNPHALFEQPALWLLAGMVLCWVAGFDVIYALQDVETDRKQNLFSLPSRLGIHRAMWISRLLHMTATACLVASWLIDKRFSTLFLLGITIVIIVLIYEHLTVARWGTTKIALAFFTLNGIISCVLGGLGILDLFDL